MPPHDALARKLQPVEPIEAPMEGVAVGVRSGVEARLATIISEVSSVSIEEILPKNKVSRRSASRALAWFMPVDILAMALGFVFAWCVAVFVNGEFFGREVVSIVGSYEGMRFAQFMVVAAGVVLWFEHTGHYRTRMPFWTETRMVVNTLAIAMIVDGFINFASKQDFSRLWLMSGWVFTAAVLLLGRNVVRSVMRKKGLWQVRTLLIGTGSTAENALATLENAPELGYEVVKQIDNLQQSLAQNGLSWNRLCGKYKADYVVIALEGKELADAEPYMANLMREDVQFSVSPPVSHVPVIGMVSQSFFSHDTVLMTRNDMLEQPLSRMFKRVSDIVMASFALMVLSPVMLIVAALVKVDGGPAFFLNERIGVNGRRFQCFKFRSMVLNADEVLRSHLENNPDRNAEWKVFKKLRGSDPRVTRVGSFLRKTSMDELPQLLNVLRGDMSIVGPRPILPRELPEYGRDVAFYYKVRPGITGLWQVSGRNEVSYARRVQMDSWYVRNWSMWHDIAIMFKTVPVLLRRDGAY